MAKSWFVCKFIQKRAEAPRTFESLRAVSAVMARLPRIISLTRIGLTLRRRASSRWLKPNGARNSSANISPGVTAAAPRGIRSFIFLTIIYDLDVMCFPVPPPEAQSPLLNDSDAVLARTISLQSLQPIPRRISQVFELIGSV
jgi:hypothetical protein